MADDQWDKRADGSLLVQPVLGYSFARLPKAALLRVIYAASQEDFDARKPSTVQLALNPPVAREMARMLNQIADNLDGTAASEAQPAAPPGTQAAAPERPSYAPPPPPDGTGEFGYSIGDDPEELKF